VSASVDPRLARKSASFSKKSPLLPSMPKSLGSLADDDRQREPDDEALEHRLRDEPREEAEPQHAGEERRRSDAQRQRRGHLHELVGAA
jgi:hypothetical protein